ncbi:MAG: hypothetical protein JO257_18040 [Deltaproteobacteria bacterium]|nr:hypothetical protein [Deltaproteobacteria bacterium]
MLVGGNVRMPGAELVVRIIKVQRVSVGILDDEHAIAPRGLVDRGAAGLELAAQRIQRGGHFGGAGCIERHEHQRLADLVGPLTGEDERAASRSTCATAGARFSSYDQALVKPRRST